jgi:hypothetical protein
MIYQQLIQVNSTPNFLRWLKLQHKRVDFSFLITQISHIPLSFNHINTIP